MSTRSLDETTIQREYYAKTACNYDDMHTNDDDEHAFAMHVMFSAIAFLGIKTVLDLGSGTGRTLIYAKKNHPHIFVKGIEPVKELREIAYGSGISREELIEGDAYSLPFEDGAFDLVCEFAMLHHVRNPEIVIKEMLRVSRKAIYISDSNGFGQGSLVGRSIKQVINSLKLWPVANFFKTLGRGYIITEGDGLSYSYSVFNNYDQIKKGCKIVHLLNTSVGGINPYRSAGSVALLGIKK